MHIHLKKKKNIVGKKKKEAVFELAQPLGIC